MRSSVIDRAPVAGSTQVLLHDGQSTSMASTLLILPASGASIASPVGFTVIGVSSSDVSFSMGLNVVILIMLCESGATVLLPSASSRPVFFFFKQKTAYEMIVTGCAGSYPGIPRQL